MQKWQHHFCVRSPSATDCRNLVLQLSRHQPCFRSSGDQKVSIQHGRQVRRGKPNRITCRRIVFHHNIQGVRSDRRDCLFVVADAASEHRECPHSGTTPTPILDAHLRQASTRARLLELRDALDRVIAADEGNCIKCTTSQAAGALFLYLRDLREAKKNGEYSKQDKKAWKEEVKGLAKDVKRDRAWLKRRWKEGQ